MLDPFTFAAAIAAALASLTAGSTDITPTVYEEVTGTAVYVSGHDTSLSTVDADDPYANLINSGEPGGYDITAEEQDGPTWSAGWVTSPYTGRLVCVTAAPCEGDPQFTGPASSSYNWVTGEVN